MPDTRTIHQRRTDWTKMVLAGGRAKMLFKVKPHRSYRSEFDYIAAIYTAMEDKRKILAEQRRTGQRPTGYVDD